MGRMSQPIPDPPPTDKPPRPRTPERESIDDWSATHPAVEVSRLPGRGGLAGDVIVRHPSYPLTVKVQLDQPDMALQAVANAYLERIGATAGVPGGVLQTLRDPKSKAFGWLPLGWGLEAIGGHSTDPRASFLCSRRVRNRRRDLTAVLVAGNRGKSGKALGGGVGLRVTIHLQPLAAPKAYRAAVTGMSTSALPADDAVDRIAGLLAEVDVDELQRSLALLGGFDKVAVEGLSWIDPSRRGVVRVLAAGGRYEAPAGGAAMRVDGLVAEWRPRSRQLQIVSQQVRLSHATQPVLVRDPASSGTASGIRRRRVTRPPAVLDTLRTPTARLKATLQRPDQLLEVRQTRLGEAAADPTQPQQIDLAKLPLRSDHLAAAHAYLRGDELLRRLQAYGLVPTEYFKQVRLPLLMRHRAPLKGARDGVAVNAQVRPDRVGPGVGQEALEPNGTDNRPCAEVSFGWAEFAHRQRLANGAGRLRDQPFGLAADARWAWHEFGHVLNLAHFGVPEFRFAHSAGDALAAIVADPDSQLGHGAGTSAGARDWFRHLSFPWVFVPRRHDRDAAAGWCWCGRRSWLRREQALPNAAPHGWLGYFEEQLLSTTLFRVYRSIGGDSADLAVRRSASDYLVYLVMRAIVLLGGSWGASATRIEHFEQALVDADIGSQFWDVQPTWPENEVRVPLHRRPGCVGKVIRWSFEQQGLHRAAVDQVAEGPARPDGVDLYIQDRRTPADGGYHPVPLAAADQPVPGWHASAAALKVANGQVEVTVRNRGGSQADDARVRCWVLPADQPRDDPSTWIPLVPSNPQPRPVASGAAVVFRFAAPAALPAGAYCVKAEASCGGDRSNIDPAGTPVSVTGAAPIVDLIANDNNLALAVRNF